MIILYRPKKHVACTDDLRRRVKSGCGLTLALVRDMREVREPSGADEVAAFETDVQAGSALARASAGLATARSATTPGT
jgi:hypothetical protein